MRAAPAATQEIESPFKKHRYFCCDVFYYAVSAGGSVYTCVSAHEGRTLLCAMQRAEENYKRDHVETELTPLCK